MTNIKKLTPTISDTMTVAQDKAARAYRKATTYDMGTIKDAVNIIAHRHDLRPGAILQLSATIYNAPGGHETVIHTAINGVDTSARPIYAEIYFVYECGYGYRDAIVNVYRATTEAPATEAPATEAPATEAPATEAPATEAPAAAELRKLHTEYNATDCYTRRDKAWFDIKAFAAEHGYSGMCSLDAGLQHLMSLDNSGDRYRAAKLYGRYKAATAGVDAANYIGQAWANARPDNDR